MSLDRGFPLRILATRPDSLSYSRHTTQRNQRGDPRYLVHHAPQSSIGLHARAGQGSWSSGIRRSRAAPLLARLGHVEGRQGPRGQRWRKLAPPLCRCSKGNGHQRAAAAYFPLLLHLRSHGWRWHGRCLASLLFGAGLACILLPGPSARRHAFPSFSCTSWTRHFPYLTEHATQAQQTLDNSNFAKFSRECPGLLDRRLNKTEVDLIFTKAKPKFKRRLDFSHFLDALTAMANKKYPQYDAATAL